MRELGAGQEGERPTTSEEEEENERLKAFKAVWEAALLEGPAGDGAELDSASAAKETPDSGTYQDRLKQAMNKIKEGESKLQVSLLSFIRSFLISLSSLHQVPVQRPLHKSPQTSNPSFALSGTQTPLMENRAKKKRNS